MHKYLLNYQERTKKLLFKENSYDKRASNVTLHSMRLPMQRKSDIASKYGRLVIRFIFFPIILQY